MQSMMRNWALLAIAFALAFSGLASFTDHITQATNDSIRVDGGLISGTTVDGVHNFKSFAQGATRFSRRISAKQFGSELKFVA
jgi:hypothetical protein